MHSKMRVAPDQLQTFDKEVVRFALQLGISEIQMNIPTLPGEKIWTFKALKDFKERIESYGLEQTATGNVPLILYDKVILGLPGRDEQTENYYQTIRSVGKPGILMLGHHFSPTFVWRTTTQTPDRNGTGAAASDEGQLRPGDNAFQEKMVRKRHPLDYDVLETANRVTADGLFNNYRHSVDAVLPTTEKAGAILAPHPDDPPLRRFGGIQRMVTSLEDYKRAMETRNSPAWGINLYLGCCSEKGGKDYTLEMVRYLGVRKKILNVRFRDARGTLLCFQECFLGEGDYNPTETLYELGKVGYGEVITGGHMLKMDYDSDYGHRARSHGIGYIQGMIQMMDFACEEK